MPEKVWRRTGCKQFAQLREDSAEYLDILAKLGSGKHRCSVSGRYVFAPPTQAVTDDMPLERLAEVSLASSPPAAASRAPYSERQGAALAKNILESLSSAMGRLRAPEKRIMKAVVSSASADAEVPNYRVKALCPKAYSRSLRKKGGPAAGKAGRPHGSNLSLDLRSAICVLFCV